MFGIKLNPCNIDTKTAVMALAGNAISGVAHLPGKAINGISALKTCKAEKAMKNKMAIISELNEVEKTIQDLTMRGVVGDELDTAVAYADMLRSKL